MAQPTTESERMTAFREPRQQLQPQVSDCPGGFSVSSPVRSSQALWTLLSLLILSISQNALASFSLTFQGQVQTLNTGGSITLNSPSDIVVDSAGDVFILDTGNNQVVEVTAERVASVVSITGLTPALSAPQGLTIDGAGNLYIADTGNNRAVKITAAGVGSVISTGSVTLSGPRGVALDQSGDLFIADTANNRIVEVTSGGPAAALTITVSSGTSTLNAPVGLAVNTAGKLYIADSGNNRIVTVASASTTGVVASILGGVTLSGPTGVAVDNIGNVYIADTNNSRIAEIDVASNGTVLYAGSLTMNGPRGVAVDAFGTIYVADTGDSLALAVDPLVNGDLTSSDVTYSLNQSVVGFGHVQLGATSAVSFTLPFTTGQAGLGGVGVFTDGVENLDFISGSGTTCNGQTPASTYCNVQVNFLPTAPGLRNGAIVLYDTSLNPLFTIPLYGWGDSPVAALSPNAASVISTGTVALSDPFQLALDAAGNMFVGSYLNSEVVKIPAGGGSASVVNLGTPGDTAPELITGVAVDQAGNLFVGDHINGRILVVTPGGVVSVLTINVLSPPIQLPTALNFDPAGNLYIAEYGGGRVIKVSSLVVAGSTSSGLGTALATGSYSFAAETLSGTAVDTKGNVYIAARTDNNSSIIKVTAAGVASVLAPTGLTFSGPQGVAVDAMGNVYVVDSGNNRIVKITTAGVTEVVKLSISPGPATLGGSLFGVTADPLGNLYIPDWTNNRLLFVNVSGSALTFPITASGATSPAQTATVTNLGDQPLAFSANPTYTANFSENAADTNPCTSTTSLSSGASCDVSVQFTPQSIGSLSAGIAVTNNTLNIGGSAQQVSVSGTSFSSGDTTSTTLTTRPTSVVVGQAATLTAVVSDTTTPANVPAGSVSFTDTVGTTVVSLNGGAPIPLVAGTATLQVTPAVVGVHTITANFVGSAPAPGVRLAPHTSLSFTSSSGTATLTVTAIVPSLSFAPIAAQTYGNPPFAVIASSPSSGAVTYTIVSGPATIAGNIVTLTGAGTVVLSASQAASGNYAAATVTIRFVVAAPLGFTLTAGSGIESVPPGGAAAFNLTLTPGSGLTYPDPLTLSATGLPAGATAAFSPATIPAGSGATAVTMTVQTVNRPTSQGEMHFPGRPPGSLALALLLLPIAGVKTVRRRLRKLPALPVVLAAAVLSLGAAACLSGCSSNGFFNQAPAQYAVVVTATDTATGAHSSANVTLTVQ
jgi:sugar lactone lactonase YvrE